MASTLAEAAVLVRLDMTRVRPDVERGLTTGLGNGGKTAGNRLVRDIDGQLAGAGSKFATTGRQIGSKAGESFGGGFTGTIRGFAGRAAGVMGTLTSAVTGVGLAGLVAFGLKSAASLEQAQIGFETLLGSGKKAQTFLTQLQTFAASTPFELPGLIDASRTLLGVGVNAKQVIPLLTAFGNTAGAVGVGQEAFQRIMIATSQAISAGKFQAGDLNQIMNNGIPIWSILAKATGKPVPELRKLASEGKLLTKDVLPLLQTEMQKDYGGAMAKQSKTLAGVWSTLKDSVAIGLANALKPLVPMLSDLIPKAATAASRALTSASAAIVAMIAGFQGKAATTGGFVGQLQNLALAAHNAWPAIKQVATIIGTILVGAIRVVVPAISEVVGWFSKHKAVAITLAATIGALVAVTKVHAAVLAVEAAGGLVKYIAQMRIVTAITKVWAAVQWLLNAATLAFPVIAIVAAVAAFIAIIIQAYKHSATFRAIVQGAWNGIKVAIGAVVNWFTGTIIPSLKKAVDQAVAAWRFLSSVVRAVWSGIRGFVQSNVSTILSIFFGLKNFITVTLPNAFRAGVGAIARAWNTVQTVARKPVAFVVNQVINPLIGGFNRIAGVFGVPKVGTIPGFESGGRIPGQASSRDNRLASLVGTAGKFLGPIKVATGEFIVNARDTARALPILQWINQGMRGGPMEITRRLGRRLTDMPGDGSEGWAFAKGGLVGFLSDVWGAVSNPAKLITKPLESMLGGIPGSGLIKNLLLGMGHKLIGGLTHWLSGATTGGGTVLGGKVGAAASFIRAQAGKPYVWASAGPGGYDCSGIVSAAWNILHGRTPYNHTFSTESLPGSYFREGSRTGVLLAGWSHPGQAPASNSTGHMAGQIAGMPFESRGSRGVVIGDSARTVGQFAHIGSAYARGGLARLAKVAMADAGRVTLERGWNLIGNGTGAREALSTDAGGVHFHFHGPVASKRAAQDMVLAAYNDLVQLKKIRPAGAA